MNTALHSPRDHGAVGDGRCSDTDALQRTIDAAHAAGGGTVFLSPGRYVSGTLILKSGVLLELGPGAELLASLDDRDFPSLPSRYPCYSGKQVTSKALVIAEDAEDIGIRGPGIINGRAGERDIVYGSPSFSIRPRLLHFRGCRRITVRDVRLLDSPSWVQHYLLCDDVVIDGLRVDSRENDDMSQLRYHRFSPGLNQDGLDIDSCRHVRVSNCHIVSGDDSICLKSRLGPCEHITVTNCTVSSNASGIKLGTESDFGFQHVVIGNCTIYDTRIGGIEVIEMDGGTAENIRIHDIALHNIRSAAIFVRLGRRDPAKAFAGSVPANGRMRRIYIQGVSGRDIGGQWGENDYDHHRVGCSITGVPGQPLENIHLRDIDLEFIGGGSTATCLQDVPEQEHGYPYPPMFGGDLPAFGFYCRHVRGLTLDGIRLRTREPDDRPALVFDDVPGARVGDLDTVDVEPLVCRGNVSDLHFPEGPA